MSTRGEPQAEQVTDRIRTRPPVLPTLDVERRRVEPPLSAEEAKARAAAAASALEAAALRRRQIELALGRQLRQHAAQARMDAQHKTNEAALQGLGVVPPTP